MRWRAFVSNEFHAFCRFGEILRKQSKILCSLTDLSDRDIEKRERMIQTYLIVFGLLLSFNGGAALQELLIKAFLFFLINCLIYYSMLTTRFFYFGPLPFNLLALSMSVAFGWALISCVLAVGSGDIPEIVYPFTILVIAFPLLVPFAH
jgi:hypothetical protein